MKIPKPTDNRPKLEPGNHLSICIILVDLGTHKSEFAGETKYLRKIRIGFETVDEKAVFSEEKGEQPFLMTKDFTLSMNQKATLRTFLESWRGKKFEETDLEGYDLKNILGKTCLLNTTINSSKDGTKAYANIVTATPVPKSMVKEVTPVNPIQYFSLEEPDWNVFESLPEFLQKIIKGSPEYKAAIGDQDGTF